MKRKITCLDLFSGGGGLTEGFTGKRFHIIAHVEKDPSACLTLQTRLSYHYLKSKNRLEEYYDYLTGKINRDQLYEKVPKRILSSVINYEISNVTYPKISQEINQRLGKKSIDIVFGGPPCQAYSIVGRGRDKDGMKFDKRKYLYLEYIKFLKEFKPRFFVFENVKGLLSSKNEKNELIIKKMVKDFEKAGYMFKHDILNASDFGVPQNRERVIIFGYRKDEDHNFPNFEQHELALTVEELFKDLPRLSANSELNKYRYDRVIDGIRKLGEPLTQHLTRPNNKQDLEIYKIAANQFKDGNRLDYNDLPKRLQSHKNKTSFTDRFKVVSPDIAHTVVAHIAKDGHYYIHPDITQNRSISVREAARLQSFPDNYFFESSRTSAYRQIGNAVPPFLAKQISKKILELF
jgi:DNA (cytosine-5)-methyltransferase 1